MPEPAKTPAAAQKLGPGVLKFGKTGSEREFQSRVKKTEFTPELTLDDAVAMLDGSDYQPEGKFGGKIAGTFYQDYSIDGLVAWCYEHAGELTDFTFTPRTDGGITFTGKCVVMPVKIGGDPKKTNEADFEFKVVDKPAMSKIGG